MANNKNLTTAATQAQATTPAPGMIPGTTTADIEKSRAQLFDLYPEVGNLYNKICTNPNTTLNTSWFTKESATLIGKFVVLMKRLEITELFPNFDSLEKVASITDGGTISEELLRALESLCKKSMKIKSVSSDEILEMKGYRDMAIFLRNIKLWDEVGCESSIITKGLRLFGVDIKTLRDCIDMEKLLDELDIQ